jgi:DNA-damage-inducible protein J
MGLSISDAIRLLMLRVVDERRSPFEAKAPNATTRKTVKPSLKPEKESDFAEPPR